MKACKNYVCTYDHYRMSIYIYIYIYIQCAVCMYDQIFKYVRTEEV